MARSLMYRNSFELSGMAWILGTAVVSLAGCDSGTGTGSLCPEGAETCHCYGNHTCNGSLTCASDICVNLNSSDAGATGGFAALGSSSSTSPLNPQGGSTQATTAATGAGPSAGGAVNVGGNANAGGAVNVGGNSNAGGAANVGGNANAGGLPAVGGYVATGGAPNMGGNANAGGAVTIGGNANAGGVPAVGGDMTTGGVITLGGQGPLGGAANTGGTLATVGGSASGGQAPATGGSATTTCGNGIVEPWEGCDPSTPDNNLGDGCTPLCKVEPSCPPTGGGCTTRCGDGFVLGDETCDDGNVANGDGCSSTCQIEADFDCTQPALGNTIVVPMVVRDFMSGGDFEKGSTFATGLYYANQGLLNPTLDAVNGIKPVLASTTGTYNGKTGQDSGIANAASFAQWYDDAAPNAGNSYNKTLATGLTLYKDVAGTAYVNRWGANGEQWIQESSYGTWCGDVGREDKDANGNPIPCTSCLFDTNTSTPQCDPAPDTTPCTTSTAPLLRCEVVSGSYEGIFLEGAFDGTPLFFPADSLTPASPSALAQIPGYYDAQSWANDPSGVKRNFSFTTEVRFWFKYDASQALTLHFVGDDDAWVFVNKKLAVDIGGIHVPVKGDLTVNTDGTAKAVVTTTQTSTSTPVSTDVSLGLEDGMLYEVAVFQAERQTTGSSYMLSFSGFNSAPSVCTHK